MKLYSLSNFVILLNLLKFGEAQSIMQSPLRDQYDGYGEEWIFMPDGNDQPQVAILKGTDPEARNVLDDQSINFILYTRSGPVNGTPLHIDDLDSLKNSDFSSSRKTKFITHGWKSSSSSAGLINMKDGDKSSNFNLDIDSMKVENYSTEEILFLAYMNHGDYNVILVDWEPLASSTFYLGPMRNTGRVGIEAGKFIDYMVNETGLKTSDVHFIGHSLGAHVAGNTGASVKSAPLGRITGLDPALPGFHVLATPTGRLDHTDADFVDVIHSCGGILGWLQPLGDADFYPNGGVAVQPGCCCVTEITEACSHGRSYVYFTESINSETGLQATKCDTWDNYSNDLCPDRAVVNMGEHVDKTAKGSYFLRTRSEPPYAQTMEKSLISSNKVDGCDEPGGWSIDSEGSPICGSNAV